MKGIVRSDATVTGNMGAVECPAVMREAQNPVTRSMVTLEPEAVFASREQFDTWAQRFRDYCLMEFQEWRQDPKVISPGGLLQNACPAYPPEASDG